MLRKELSRLESLIGEECLRLLLISVIKCENNWALSEKYHLPIHDLRYLSHNALECAALLLEDRVTVSRVIRMAG